MTSAVVVVSFAIVDAGSFIELSLLAFVNDIAIEFWFD
ncbi:isoleucyl-tRNA synthetase [Lactococcus lactis subsp. lactis]|uniref:Isoleucyl-tRNA synthetase n=1 Tax=Lactococcus lactis subsp. lactis TaxID=1360 RepID=A0A0B8QJS3_LACLL|nr:isoleucyl-tRNA synthetase [Lactococcus lactis subsp. lactis]